MSSNGHPAYRTNQLWEGLYRHGYATPEAFLQLPTPLRKLLVDSFSFISLAPAQTTHSSDNKTTKFLFDLVDGPAIETILMRYESRRTACISTQAGCALACAFCATGQMGFRRHLTSGEMIEQTLYVNRLLSEEGERLTNLVIMGMGEPFHNYDPTLEAIDRLTDPAGFNMGARRITISTVGWIPGIDRFTQENRQVNLAVSLHGATDALRDQIVPINKRFPLKDLFHACRNYVKRTGRRITFEWVLIRDLNDSLEQANALASQISGLNCHVNLIPLNPTMDYPGKPSRREQVEAFQQVLLRHKIPCTLRVRRGIDIQAGCGQLSTQRKSL